jgi:hypothetical protein
MSDSNAYDHDQRQLNRLRQDFELHNCDRGRAKISADPDGTYTINFDRAVVQLGPMPEGVPIGTVRAHSAEGAEVAYLDGLIRLHRAERQRVRLGVVCGWDSSRINRCPLSDDEIAAYKARIGHAAKVAQLQAELSEALAAQAVRADAERGADQLAQRYGVTAMPAQPTTEHPTLSAKPAKRQRRKEVNHE